MSQMSRFVNEITDILKKDYSGAIFRVSKIENDTIQIRGISYGTSHESYYPDRILNDIVAKLPVEMFENNMKIASESSEWAPAMTRYIMQLSMQNGEKSHAIQKQIREHTPWHDA